LGCVGAVCAEAWPWLWLWLGWLWELLLAVVDCWLNRSLKVPWLDDSPPSVGDGDRNACSDAISGICACQ
jgi:hypothetical protein